MEYQIPELTKRQKEFMDGQAELIAQTIVSLATVMAMRIVKEAEMKATERACDGEEWKL